MKKSREIVRFAAVALAALVSLPAPALAGAPDPGTKNASLLHRCKGGAQKGEVCQGDAGNQFCFDDVDCNNEGFTHGCDLTTNTCDEGCEGSPCEFAFIGKTHAATLTAVFDEDVSDSVNNVQKTGRALTLLMEVGNKAAGKKILAETYRHATDGDIFIGIWNAAVTEPDFVNEIPQNFVFQVPPGTMAEGLRQFFGETGIPLVISASKKIEISDNQGNDSCEAAGVPQPCCTGFGTGTCDRNSECTAPATPHLCCQATGVGTCNTRELASALRLKVKLRFVEAP
jgi:hypothetical protein